MRMQLREWKRRLGRAQSVATSGNHLGQAQLDPDEHRQLSKRDAARAIHVDVLEQREEVGRRGDGRDGVSVPAQDVTKKE